MKKIVSSSLLLALMSSYGYAETEFSNLVVSKNSVQKMKSKSSTKYSKSTNSGLSIGNYVWFDYNQNGQQDLGELGIFDVKVNLYDNASCSGRPINTTQTTDIGYYEFKNLETGTQKYCVGVVYPNYWTHTIAKQGNGLFDSNLIDMNDKMGKIPNINLSNNDKSLDAGLHHKNPNCQIPTLQEGLTGTYGNEDSWAKRYTLDVKINDVVAQGFCHELHDHGPKTGEKYTVHNVDRRGFSSLQRDRLSRIFSYMSDPEILTQIDNFFEEKDREKFFAFASNTLIWYYSDWDRDFSKIEDNIYHSWWNKYTTDNEKVFFTDIIKMIISKVEGTDGYVQYPSLKVYYLWNNDNTGHQDIIVPSTLIVPNQTECTTGAYSQATIGDRVWLDSNYNGIQDASEEGVSNVNVELYNKNNQRVSETKTDSNGMYIFEKELVGSYYVKFAIPNNYTLTSKGVGGDRCKDSDVDQNGKTSLTKLSNGENDLCWDMGIYNTPKPAIDIETSTNGNDADAPTGAKIEFGKPVKWEYVVINKGNVALTDVKVRDDKSGEICTIGTLAINESKTCEKTTTAKEGQYENIGTVEGIFNGKKITDSDPTHYLGGVKPVPAIDIETSTNGDDADKPTGPTVDFGSKVTWKYVVKNSGNVALKDVEITDSKLNKICTIATLAVGESKTCTKEGTAEEGQYSNVGTVKAKSPKDTEVTDSDPSHYNGGTKTIVPPVVLNDNATGNSGEHVTLDPLANDSSVESTLDPKSVILTSPDTVDGGKKLAVDGEGVWSVDSATGKITFTPEQGFTGDPTPVTYTVNDIKGNSSNEGTVTIDYPQTNPVAKNDSKAGERCKAVIVDILANDNDAEKDLDNSSVEFVVLNGWSGTDSDGDGDIDNVVVPDMGRWSVDNSGKVVYTPTNNCSENPTPVKYSVKDKTGKVSNEVTVTVTYPEVELASLGDFVWFDADKNGKQDNGESGLKGVEVKLYDANGEVNATTTTDENGTYLFVNLEAGEYSVKFIEKDGFSLTKQMEEGIDDSKNSDANSETGITETIILNEGDNNLSIDAGMYITPKPAVKITKETNGGKVDNIVEGDTVTWTYVVSNIGNEPLSNLVIIDNKEGEVSDCKGDGSLDGLNPSKSITCTKVGTAILGAYENKVIVQASSENVDVNDSAKSSYVGKDSPVLTGSVGDYVWLDSNHNGIQDANELPLSGIVVKLFDKSGKEKASTKTDASGKYNFADVVAGKYYIEFTLPSGYRVTTQDKGDDSLDSDADTKGKTALFSLSAGEDKESIDMGLYPMLVELGNRVWYDANRNGIQDADEKKSVADVTVKLYKEGGEFVTETKTRVSGYYAFKNLIAGNYYVVFEAPDNYKVSPHNVGSNDSDDSDANPTTGKTDIIKLIAGIDNRTVDMGLYQEASKVGDRVWYDANKNGIQDEGENGVGNVTVKLYFAGETEPTEITKTSANGIYLFDNVAPADYYIVFTAPAAYTITEANKGNDTKDSDADNSGRTDNFRLLAGTQNSTIDMGVYQNVVSLGDKVWLDSNHDGLQDIGETGVRDVKVTIHSETNDFAKTVRTDENGNYLFTHLSAGEYSVEFEDVPYGHLVTQKDVNGNENDLNDSDVFVNADKKLVTEGTLLTPGENDLSWDMGIYKTVCLPGKAVLGNLVWEDFNKNGIQDIGERGVANVKALLFNNDTDEKVAETLTDENGLYEFAHLDPEFNYYVQFTVPAGYVVSPQDQDDDIIDSDADATGKTDVITLTADQINSTVDMGIHHEGSTIGDRVWFDEKGGISNGLEDEGENGVQDVKVTLYSANGDEVKTTQTNASGEYHFTNVPKGNYTIGFSELPDGYVFSIKDQGDNEEADSDVNANGRTDVITINGVHNLTHIDAGIKTVRTGDAGSDIQQGEAGKNVVIDVLANDNEGTFEFDAATVKITSTPDGATLSEDGKTLTVPNEGVWSVDPVSGAITFTPNDGFVGDPTAISYTVSDTQGNESGADVEVNYPPLAQNDFVNGEVGKQIVIYVLDNDSNTSTPLDKSTVRIINPENGDEVESITVAGEGVWSTNSDGSITFTPEYGFETNPTPIEYTVKEQSGDVSNSAIVTIVYPDAVDDVIIVPVGHTGDIIVNVVENDSNNTESSLVSLGCREANVKSLTVDAEGIWTVTDNGTVTFAPIEGFVNEPTDINYTVGLVSGVRSNCANIDVRFELLTRDDSSLINVGTVTLIAILNNDYGSLNPESVKLILPEDIPAGSRVSEDGKTLTVRGEGIWSVNSEGIVSFRADDGFIMTPTPINYSVENSSALVSNISTITLTQGGDTTVVATNNTSEANAGNPIVIDVLSDDRGDLNGSIVYILDSDGTRVDSRIVAGEGTWQVNADQTVTFTPEEGYTGTPTPIEYVIQDRHGAISNTATITIAGVCTCKTYEESISSMSDTAGILMFLLTLLLTIFFFEREENMRYR